MFKELWCINMHSRKTFCHVVSGMWSSLYSIFSVLLFSVWSLSTLPESALKAAGVFVLEGRFVKRMTPIILSAEAYLPGSSALVNMSPR